MTELERYTQVIEKVKRMRICQKSYFQYRDKDYLNEAKVLETEVDNMIKDLSQKSIDF